MKLGSFMSRAAKKWTKKRDARAKVMFCYLNFLLFAILVAIAIIVD